MADNLHNALAQFRDTLLTAVARLEFTLRDIPVAQPYVVNPNATWVPNRTFPTPASEVSESLSDQLENSEHFQILSNTLDGLVRRVAALEMRESRGSPSIVGTNVLEVNDMSGILEMQPPAGSRNIIVKTPAVTPALAAAIAAANPPDLNLSTGDSAATSSEDEHEEQQEEPIEDEEVREEEDQEEGEDQEEDQEEGEVQEEEDEEEPDLRPVTYKEKQYFVDAEHSLYIETDEGYEEVGKWDPSTESAEFYDGVAEEEEDAEKEEVEEAEEEEAEEEAVEVEEFEYKGKTYQRDDENNVYLDGEHIGTWNGKKIVLAS